MRYGSGCDALCFKVTEEIEKGDTVFTMAEFTEDCRDGNLIDYDGEGVYATATHKSDIGVLPSDVPFVDRGWSHVVWYNR